MNNKYEAISTSQQLSIGDMIVRLLNGIKKYWYLIPILACIGCCFMVINAYRSYVPMYSATATFTVSQRSDTISSYSSSNVASSAQITKTFPYIITSAPMTRVVARDLKLTYMPGTISAKALPDTNLFTITATSSDYQMAYKLLKSVINNYPEVAEYVVGDTDMVLVVPPSASADPTNTVNYRLRALIGTGVGVAVALAIIMLIELFNITVRKADDIELLLNSERIGATVKVIKKKSSNVTDIVSLESRHIDSRYKESVYSIRNTLLKKCDARAIRSIMVTSTDAGEGKTTFAANLAISLRKKHLKTIIIDCDLRNPTIRKQFNIPLKDDSFGIVDVVTGKCSLEDALVRLKRSGLYVLPGTIPVENASELMGSKQMTELIGALKSMFDYVIIDVPPVGVVADALEIRDGVGGVLFVVRQDYIKVSKIKEAISSFGGSRINILGCVFNMASGVFGSKGYGRYGYGNYGYGGYGMFNKDYYRGEYGYGYGYNQDYGDFLDEDEPEEDLFEYIGTKAKNLSEKKDNEKIANDDIVKDTNSNTKVDNKHNGIGSKKNKTKK